MSFQDPATLVMSGIIDLHHGIFFYMIIVITLVSWMLFSVIRDFGYNMYITKSSGVETALKSRNLFNFTKNITHGEVIEIVWTITPSLVLVGIAVPSFALLYTLDELMEPTLTLKSIGHQWYWSYEYSDFDNGGINFDSYMVSEGDLPFGRLRLLEVDRKVWLPIDTHIRVIITAVDVLHSWAVPSLGVKMDAVPGRLNQIGLFINREGLFYGQCSEICGVNHGFMPICVKAVSPNLFNGWLNFNLNK